jgi:hypothetical protein
MSLHRFRIAFSFAGEKRDFVAKIAAILAKRFSEDQILYDKYHKAEFARARLGRYLPKLYYDQSALVVVILCRKYNQKEWCGLEWDAIFDLIKQRREDEVMLCRFDMATADGLFSDTGYADLDNENADQAAALILERLAKREGYPRTHYTSGAGARCDRHLTSVPNNLPRLPCFFGRETQLKAIQNALNPEQRTWGALIHGHGGMGKTALAIQSALDAEPDWFTRIVFVSAKEMELTPKGPRSLSDFSFRTCLEILTEVAHLHGHNSLADTSEDKRVKQIHDILRSERTLLVLDNLETLPDSEQDRLFTFIGKLPQACKAIVTSRKRPVDEGSVIHLGKLTKNAALDYLNELAAYSSTLQLAKEAQRISLYQETGGNPLLMRWVVGQLGRGSCKTIRKAIDFLGKAPTNINALDFILGDIANDLSANEIKAINGLENLRGPTDAKTLAKEVKLSKLAAETVLSDLNDRGLIDADPDKEYFSILPVVVAYVKNLSFPFANKSTGSKRSRN